ncbi:hypothetical protein BYT27DRAFT_7167768 [Phlegmacium glaucopus]|nr:hypothetical protein BYT27DRAFT_7167768 [Phlegmacium glaucopus]
MEEDTFYQFRRFYPTSNARSEPLPTFASTRQIVSSSLQPPSPPLWTPPSSPVRIEQGLWQDGEDLLHSSDWPPVQQYLSETSKNRRLAPAPTEIVFALAALEVLHQPHNPVHWLFWGAAYLSSTSKAVNKIALHRPRLIKTNVPWIGISEYKRVISAIQEKWEYVHVRKRWYPVDGQPETSTKRHLRSSSGRVDQTINNYFNLPEDGEPPLKRTRRGARKVAETQDLYTVDRAKRAKIESKPSPSAVASDVTSIDAHVTEDSPPATRASSRKRLKTTPSTMSPPPASLPPPSSASSLLLSSTTLTAPVPCFMSSASSSHSRNRSTSQSSAETLVESAEEVQLRSASVASAETAIETPFSRKRKLEAVEECLELAIDETPELNRREGMVTRGRASKFRLVETNAETSVAIASRSNIPAKGGKAMTEPKPRAKKSRAKK